jgi:hypothetical protein
VDIDNSRFEAFCKCPYYYFEKYEAEGNGLEVVNKHELFNALQYGGRVHELLEEHYLGLPIYSKYPANGIEPLEKEAVAQVVAYKAHYPNEEFKVIDVEHTFRLPIPNSKHHLIGKIDVTARSNVTEHLDIIDHKTQARSSKSNDPRKWAAAAQASLYLWAARELYFDETVDNFYVNVLVRQSPAGQIGPSFPERQKLERTHEQIEKALVDIATIADTIETYREKFGSTPWPSNTKECFTWSACDFYKPHTYGWSDEIRKYEYQPRTEYLQIGKEGSILDE